MKPEPDMRWFQHPQRGQAVVNVSEKHVGSLLLNKAFFFSLENFGEILRKVFFLPIRIMARKSTLPANFLKNATSWAKSNVIATVQFTNDDISVYDGPRMLIRNTAKPCIKST